MLIQECRELVHAVFPKLFLGHLLLDQHQDVVRQHFWLRLAKWFELLHKMHTDGIILAL
jgi:hypothetical protein